MVNPPRLLRGLPSSGHAPGDIRDAFEEAVEAYPSWDAPDPEPTIEVRGEHLTIRRVASLLWNCTDIMPSHLCSSLDMDQGSTYAQGARELRRMVKRGPMPQLGRRPA